MKNGPKKMVEHQTFKTLPQQERDGVLGLVSDGVWFPLDGPEASAP